MNKKETIMFQQDVPPNTSVVLKERIKGAGTIEKVKVRFYSGQEFALQVEPYIMKKGDMKTSLITYNGDVNYLKGEDDNFSFSPVLQVFNDDELHVSATNTDLVNTYSISVMVEVDFYGNENRVVS